ncbi:hypothetical protein FQA39_LY02998 [Lamprigera yunnana]|nr:hypothetical protein FQA39_LY02998 [Lamprigera yunnana]
MCFSNYLLIINLLTPYHDNEHLNNFQKNINTKAQILGCKDAIFGTDIIDSVTTPSNDPQISVTSEVIEQVAAERDKSGRFENLESTEENIFHEMSDEEIIKKISSSKTINQEDDYNVIATTPQLTAQDEINAFELGLQWADEKEWCILQ